MLVYSPAVTPYISETAHPKIRGILVTLRSFVLTIGLLTTWTLGYFLPWRIHAYILTIPPIILIMLLFLFPETPYWLIEHNNIKAAQQSLQFFRGEKYDISEEFNEIQKKHETKKTQYKGQSWKFVLLRICSPAFLKPFTCVGILYSLTAWSGFSPLVTYTFEILDEAGTSIEPGIGLIIIGSIRIVFAGTYKLFYCIKGNIHT